MRRCFRHRSLTPFLCRPPVVQVRLSRSCARGFEVNIAGDGLRLRPTKRLRCVGGIRAAHKEQSDETQIPDVEEVRHL